MLKKNILIIHLKDIWDRLHRIFTPICWFTGIYYQVVYKQIISGHSYIEQEDGNLKCEICGKVS